MITINIDISTGIAKPTQSAVIKAGAQVPVRILFSASPGTVTDLQLAFSAQSSSPAVLAFLDVFDAQNATTFTGTLDANDTRLLAAIAGKQNLPLDCELAWTADGKALAAPNFTVTAQPRVIAGPASSEGGPVWLNETQSDGRYEARARRDATGGYAGLTLFKINFKNALNSFTSFFTIRTRIEPADWATVKEFALIVGDAKADGAEKTNGYIAAKSDEAFRIETRATDGLDKRDGRVTPVRGDFAWFRRNDFNLTLHIARRTPEVRATLTGYALPIAGALSVHAEIGYDVDFSGVKVFRVKVPKESAAQFYFDGEQIAERKLDGDTWTITLQKETLGRYALKVGAMLPFARGADAKFEIGVRVIVPLDVQRERGTWVVEANTDTEITFEASGMNEIDSLHAPALADYQPEHRIIGVFDYLGGQPHALKLLGESLAYEVAAKTVQRSADVHAVYQVNHTKIELVAAMTLDSREPLFSATLAMPADFVVQAVESERLRDWWRDGDTLNGENTQAGSTILSAGTLTTSGGVAKDAGVSISGKPATQSAETDGGRPTTIAGVGGTGGGAGFGGNALAKPRPSTTPTPMVMPKKESLKTEGRVSLAVDFPTEGRVHHFKKLKADARLTLSLASMHYAARFGWFALFLTLALLLRYTARQHSAYTRRRAA